MTLEMAKKELDKIAKYLSEHNYKYEYKTKDFYGRIGVYDDHENEIWDVIILDNNDDSNWYLEYGFADPENYFVEAKGDIVGWDDEEESDVARTTAQEIIYCLEHNVTIYDPFKQRDIISRFCEEYNEKLTELLDTKKMVFMNDPELTAIWNKYFNDNGTVKDWNVAWKPNQTYRLNLNKLEEE